ncbi:MAG: hypothetical protein U0798_11600 [Gemmataceae bacterium]
MLHCVMLFAQIYGSGIAAADVQIKPEIAKQEAQVITAMREWGNQKWYHCEFGIVALPLSDQTNQISFSPDSTRIASHSNEHLRVFDLKRGTTVFRVNIENAPMLALQKNGDSLAWSQDGKLLAMPAKDKIIVRSSATGELIKEFSIKGIATLVRFSTDGKRLVVAYRDSQDFSKQKHVYKQLKISDWSAAAQDYELPGYVPAQDISPDGDFLIRQLPNVQINKPPHSDLVIRNLVTGQEKTMKSDMEWLSMRLSSDKEYIVGLHRVPNTYDKGVTLLHLKTGKSMKIGELHKFDVYPSLTPDGKAVFFTDRSDHIRFFSTETGKEIWSQPKTRDLDVVFSPGGRLMAVNRIFFDARSHIFDFHEQLNPIWAADVDNIVKARAAGVEIDLNRERIRFQNSTIDSEIGSKFAAAHAAYPKANSVRIGRSLGSSTFDHQAVFAALKKYEHLEELLLENTNITDDNLKQISEMTNLKYLSIDSTMTITAAGLAHLKSLKKLESLKLTNCSLLREGVWEALAPLSQLKHLELRYQFQGKPAGMEKISELKNLVSLKLGGNEEINGSIFKHFNSMKQLETLELNGFPFKDSDLDDIAVLKSLKHLQLDYRHIPFTQMEFTNKGVEKLKPLPDLTTLSLSNGYELHLKALNGFDLKKITHLNIAGFEVHGDDLKYIENASELKFLSLPSFPRNDKYSFETIRNFEKLEAVQLTYSLFNPGYGDTIRKLKTGVFIVP